MDDGNKNSKSCIVLHIIQSDKRKVIDCEIEKNKNY